MMYLGDYNEDDTLYFLWSSNSAAGASITRATNGTVSVYKDNGTTQTTTGITDTEDFDSLTGIHACTIDLSADAFYATGADYAVVLSAATIDGQTVNAVLAHFSIENRYHPAIPTASAIAAEVHASTMDSNVIEVGGSSTVVTSMVKAYQTPVAATAITGTLAATTFTTNLTAATNDTYNGRLLVFITGTLAGQAKLITDYVGASKTVTVESFTGAPSNADEFVIL
jgi:hypothetical protein